MVIRMKNVGDLQDLKISKLRARDSDVVISLRMCQWRINPQFRNSLETVFCHLLIGKSQGREDNHCQLYPYNHQFQKFKTHG